MPRDLEADLKLCESMVGSSFFYDMADFVIVARNGWAETILELIEARKQIRELQRKLRTEIGTYAAETRYMELILGEALELPFYPDPDDGIDMTGKTTVGLCQEAADKIEQLQAIREKLESKEED